MSCSIIGVINKKEEYSYIGSSDCNYFDVLFCSFFSGKEACALSQIKKQFKNSFEMRMILSGECELRCENGKEIQLCANQFFTIPKETTTDLNYISDDCTELVLLFDCVPSISEETNIYNVINTQLQSIGVYQMNYDMITLVNILKKLCRNTAYNKYLASSYLYLLSTEASRIIIANKSKGLLYLYDEPRIEKAIKYIEKNISNSIDTSDVAKEVYLSEKQLKRLFLSHFGTTVYEYISAYKYNLSRRLLQETSIPISEIAEQTGFSESTSFSRFFKRYEGVSPSEFRLMSNMEMSDKTICPK